MKLESRAWGGGAPGKAEKQADVGRGEVADSVSERDTRSTAAAKSGGQTVRMLWKGW